MTLDDRPEAHFTDQRVLLTGASGFLGSRLCSKLVAAGAEIYAVSRVPRVSADDHVHWCHANIEDLAIARRLICDVKPAVIFHLGGLVSGATEIELVLPTFHSLVESTVNLLTVAADSGCQRIVLVGSLEEPDVETAGVCKVSPYGVAKWAASTYGRMFHNLFELPVVIARTYMAYGPGQATRKIIPYTILSLLGGETPRFSSGQRQLDWVYVDDVVEGLLLAGSTPGLDGATVELGSGTLTPIRDIVARLVNLLGPSVEPVFGVLPDRPRYLERAARVAETRSRMGWSPVTPLDDGLARTVAWYRCHSTSTEQPRK